MSELAHVQGLVDRANAGVPGAIEQLLNPPRASGRIAETWKECIQYPDGYRLGRNDLPAALWDAFSAGVLTDPGEVALGVAEAWVMAEYPLLNLEWLMWDELFQYVGFVSDSGSSGHGQTRPAPPVLYRSAHPDFLQGMSWTSDLATAWWFASRNRRMGLIPSDGVALLKVETANCPWWEPYGAFDGRAEHEWIMPVSRTLPVQEIRFPELDRIALEGDFESARNASVAARVLQMKEMVMRREPYRTESKPKSVESARLWCRLLEQNRGERAPRASVVQAILQHMPIREAAARTGYTVAELEAFRDEH